MERVLKQLKQLKKRGGLTPSEKERYEALKKKLSKIAKRELQNGTHPFDLNDALQAL